jgi:hypothetical protein
MDEEAKQLLREIRDLMAASTERYDKALAQSKRQYEEHLAKSQRLALVFVGVVGAGVAAVILLSR